MQVERRWCKAVLCHLHRLWFAREVAGSKVRPSPCLFTTPRQAIASVVLEEVVQALGLLTDIRSPVYRRSIFAEDSNSGIRLRGQDAMVIRRHYPPT